MKFEKVNYIPVNTRRKRGVQYTHPTCRMIYGFINSDITAARVIWSPDEYKSPTVLYQALYKFIKKYYSEYNIHALMRQGEVYLVKGDLNELL